MIYKKSLDGVLEHRYNERLSEQAKAREEIKRLRLQLLIAQVELVIYRGY